MAKQSSPPGDYDPIIPIPGLTMGDLTNNGQNNMPTPIPGVFTDWDKTISTGMKDGADLWRETFLGPSEEPGRPDFTAAAEKQTQENRPNFNNPFGSQQRSKDANGNWTNTTSFSPQFSGLFGYLSGQASSAWDKPLDNGQQARDRAENAIYSRETSRLDPMFNQRDQAMRSQLESQGLDPNSEAYRRSMDDFGRTRNDAYQGAMNQSIAGGGAEAQRQMGMDLMSRNAPMQALSGLYGLASQTPNFMPSGNYLGAAEAQGKFDQTTYNTQMKAAADRMKGLMSSYGSVADIIKMFAGGGE